MFKKLKFCHVQLFCILIKDKMPENDCEPYNKQFIDLACSVCTVKYRTLFFYSTDSLAKLAWSVLRNLSLIFHGTDLTKPFYSI